MLLSYFRGPQAGSPRGKREDDQGSQQEPLTSLQILRMLYVSLATASGFHKQNAIVDLSKAKWLGDGPVMRAYMNMMEDMFEEIGGFSDHAKREIVSEHMRFSQDPNILADLACFDRAGDMYPPGPEYTFEFLKRSVYRRTERAEFVVEREKGLKAREKEVNSFLKEGEKLRKEHEQRVREGKVAPWAMTQQTMRKKRSHEPVHRRMRTVRRG